MWLKQFVQSLLILAPVPQRRKQQQRKPKRRATHLSTKRHNTRSYPGNRPKGNPKPRRGRIHPQTSKPNWRTYTVYHGTPQIDSARAIFRNGFLVGAGNLSGDGIYFSTDRSVAKSYAGTNGVIIKCHIAGKTCQWNTTLQAQYARWCQSRNIAQDNSARTAFLLQRGFEVLHTGNVIVVLSPQMANPSAWQQKDHRIRTLAAFQASNNQRIYV